MTGMPDPLPLVSVIVSSGCDERQLQAALESVFAQDHTPIEILVIESGLGDRTAQMAREYLGQERVRSRVRRAAFVAAEAGIDLPAALNRAVLESHGEYIGLLNGDERFAAGRLTALLGACVTNGAQIAFSRVEPIAGETAPSSAEIEHVYSVQDNVEFFPTVGYALLRHPCMLSPGNLFFSRALFDRVGGFAPLPHAYAWDFALRALLVTEPVFVPKPLYCYRLHRDNDFHAEQKLRAAEADRVLRDYLFHCRNHPVANPLAPSPAWGPFFTSFVQASPRGRVAAAP